MWGTLGIAELENLQSAGSPISLLAVICVWVYSWSVVISHGTDILQNNVFGLNMFCVKSMLYFWIQSSFHQLTVVSPFSYCEYNLELFACINWGHKSQQMLEITYSSSISLDLFLISDGLTIPNCLLCMIDVNHEIPYKSLFSFIQWNQVHQQHLVGILWKASCTKLLVKLNLQWVSELLWSSLKVLHTLLWKTINPMEPKSIMGRQLLYSRLRVSLMPLPLIRPLNPFLVCCHMLKNQTWLTWKVKFDYYKF